MEQPSVQEWPDQTADRMRASEALYQPLTDNIDLITWVRRRDENRLLYVSQSMERIWGRPREPLYEDSSAMLDGIHPDDLPALMEAMSKYRDGGMDETFRILTPSGKIRWLRARTFLLPGPRGAGDRIAGVAQDITEQKEIEEQLRITLANLRERYAISRRIGAARTAEDVLIALRSLSTLSEVSRASLLVFDTAGQPARGFTTLVDWVDHDAAPAASADGEGLPALSAVFTRDSAVVVSDVATDGRISEPSKDWLRSLGTRSLLLFPLITSNEWFGMLVVHFLTVLHIEPDEIGYVEKIINQAAAAIYNFHLLEAEIRARKEAEQANEIKLRFLAMISHELRTPLASIKGFATTLLADDVTWDAASQREFLETINTEADKLTDLIGHLLDLSRLESGTLRILPERYSLAAVVETVTKQLRDMLAEHRLLVSLPSDLPPLWIDPQRATQVISNLVVNAIKYSPPGSQIMISAVRVGKKVQVNVSDQGPGIPLELQQKVFEPFFQEAGRPSREKTARGMGLGLAICKGLVEAHGGRIWIDDSAGNTGTTISFTLPIAGVANAQSA